MKTKATAGILAGLLACSLVGGGYSLLGAKAGVVGNSAGDWGTVGNATATYADDGFVEIKGTQFSDRAYYKDKVKVEGLTVQWTTNTPTANTFGGFYFWTDSNIDMNGVPAVFSLWHKRDSSTFNRFSIAKNHDCYGAQLFYSDDACTSAGFGYGSAADMIMNDAVTTHFTISFESYSDTAYKVKVAISDPNVLHGSHSTYGEGDGMYWCEGYMKKETLAPALDENGCATILFSATEDTTTYSVKLSDDNIRAYYATDVPVAQEKVTAYENAQITDADSYDAAMEAREAALAAVSGLKAREKAELTERMTAVDAGYKTNATVQTIVKGLVQDKITAADTAFAAIFNDESTLNDESVEAVKNKLIAAENEYDAKETMLSDANKTELTAAIVASNYSWSKLNVLQWIVNYEGAIEALDTTADTIGADIAAVKATKHAFTGSALEGVLNRLETADKTEYENRITAADEALNAKEEGAEVAVKTVYVVAFEDALESLNTYSKITNAFNAKNNLEENITLTEEDGELYTRYNNGVETLYTALETFITNAINAVDTALDGEFVTLASFTSVRSDYNSIALDLLDENRAQTATITAAYSALTDKIKSNMWYNFSQTGMTTVEQNETGIYFEQPGPKFPDRINYNKKLDLSKGVEVVIEFTNIAYYNGDMTQDGNSKGANNLSINFLNTPNAYKSQDDGINIIIWLFEVESSVQIMDKTDKTVANGVIATPLNGGKLTINLKHGIYEDFVSEESYAAYILTINGVEIVMADTLAAANGIQVNDECYFSFGSFADYKADPNCFTLISVDGETFEKKDTPVNPIEPVEPDDPVDPVKPAKKGCGSEIGAYSLLAACFALATAGAVTAIVLKKKKNQE